jgi:hypothetical protein
VKKLILIIGVLGLVVLYSSERKVTPLAMASPTAILPSSSSDENKPKEFTEFAVQDPSQLKVVDLKKAIAQIDEKIKKFEMLSFDQFSPKQMNEFKSLNRQKAVLMKAYIFKKFRSYI